MRRHPIAKRYARALFELADEKGQLETIKSQVHSFQELLDEYSRFRAFLLTPEVRKSQKLAVATELLKDHVPPIFLQFVRLLIEKGRQDIYEDIAWEFDRLYEMKNHLQRARLTSAVSLGHPVLEEVKQTLAERLDAKVLLESRVDPDILGGFIIEVEGKAIDGSLRRQLELMKARLKKQKPALG